MELEQLAQQAIAIVKQAGELIRSIPRPHVYTKEGHANFVTEADMASQRFLIEHLSPLLPEAHFFAEEQEENKMAPGWNWVIDPIDGTTNFIRGYRPSSISVGLVKDGVGMLGIVLDPFAGELFSAVKGGGTFRNGEPIHVADIPLENALVAGVGHKPNDENNGKGAGRPLRGLAPERLGGGGFVPLGRGPAGRLLRAAPLPLGLRRQHGYPPGGGGCHRHRPRAGVHL